MGDKKFRAFISYSHADEHWGAWLQRSLEQFRAPKELARQIEAAGRPLRLSPVFRDREDLPVAGNLNEAIQKALADSEHQIVLCSPNAAKSRWVNEEIKLFNRLHGPGRTFAIIIAGEPGGGEQECFPPALRFKLDQDGEPTAAPAEPLAADAREDGDGKRYALLKTAAGMLGVGLDDLVRRDAQRRARRARWIAASASLVAASMTFAAVFAISQRNEAREARGEAENLIEFMLSDLSDRLEPVGRLDILEEVGGEVLQYYDNQDLRALDAEALSRRARGLMQLGNVDQRRGDLGAALVAFQTAFDSTEENLRRAPNDPDRMFDHAQSVFYMGSVARSRGDIADYKNRNLEYLRLAERLVQIDPKNPKWRLELAFATSNIGSVFFEERRYEESISYFERSVESRKVLSDAAPGDRKIALAYAYALSWLGYAQLSRGDYRESVATYDRQFAIYVPFVTNGVDFQILDALVSAKRRQASALLNLGDVPAAKRTFDEAALIADKLVARDAASTNALVNAAHIARFQSVTAHIAGDHESEVDYADSAIRYAREYANREGDSAWKAAPLAAALARRISAHGADHETRLALAAALDEQCAANESADYELIAQILVAIRDEKKELRPCVDAVERRFSTMSDHGKLLVAHLYFDRGDRKKSLEVLESISNPQFRHPDLFTLKTELVEGEVSGVTR